MNSLMTIRTDDASRCRSRACAADQPVANNWFDVGERLEFQRIAERIEQEHRCLLARLAIETHVGLDDEFDLRRSESNGERIPRRHGP